MWIEGAVTLLTMLAPGLSSGVMKPTGDAGRLDPSVSHIHAQQVSEPRIWLDRRTDPVLEPGDRVRIYYRTPADTGPLPTHMWQSFRSTPTVRRGCCTRALLLRVIMRGRIGIIGCSSHVLLTGMSMTGQASGIFLS